MPWLTIIVWLVSFLLQKKQGVSTGKAALTSTALGVGTYYLADPANADNVLGVTLGGSKPTSGDPTAETPAVPPPSAISGNVVSEVGETLRSWGPTGTLTAVAGTVAAASIDWKKWLPWIGLGAGVLLLTR